MKIVVDINHPAHVHYFKHFIWKMQEKGHDFLITASDKDVSYRLLDAYGFDYIKLGNYGSSFGKKLFNLPLMSLRMYGAIINYKPDLCLGAGSIRAAHAAYLLKIPSIIMESTEHSSEQIRLYLPFVKTILTPSCFMKDLGPKQIRYSSYKELMYLHPNYFTPNSAVLDELDLSEDDPFIIVRFVSWGASHDVGQHGIRDKVGLVKALEQHGRVIITSEGELPHELQSYRIRVSPEKLHDLLYYATLYVGEGATTASECAVLGTHAIYVNTLSLGYIAEEAERYDLVSDFSTRLCTDETVLAEANKLLEDHNLWAEGKRKVKSLLQDKIDVTAFMVWFVENYPESIDKIKNDPELQNSLEFH